MASPVKKSVELFYDVVSPYSWIAFEVLNRYQTRWPIDLKLKPFFLGGVMQESGNRPPAMVPNKAIYMISDVKRLRRHYQIPLSQPQEFMAFIAGRGSLPAMRFITAVDMAQPDKTEELSRQLWMRLWGEDNIDIGEPEGIKQAALKAGLSEQFINDALSRSKSDEVKERLKAYTAQALDHSAFGAPTIIITDDKGEKHLVFGSDRFPIIADILGRGRSKRRPNRGGFRA